MPLFPADVPFCRQIANYSIEVQLDTVQNLISGYELLTWTNDTEEATNELWFHLYWNAFQNSKSTFLSGRSGRGGRISKFQKEDWGFCRVERIALVSDDSLQSTDLTRTMEFLSPDDGNPFDRTVFRVSLPDSVQPGQSVSLQIAFISKIPRPIARTGVYKENYFIAQWFPKIGVFQNGQWNCHQYHPFSEYFADYGTYDVRITLPEARGAFDIGHQEGDDALWKRLTGHNHQCSAGITFGARIPAFSGIVRRDANAVRTRSCSP